MEGDAAKPLCGAKNFMMTMRLLLARTRPVCALLAAVAALSLCCADAARAQDQYFDADGEVIGVVNGNAIVGENSDSITVTANAGTNVTISLSVHNQAELIMTGGTVGGNLGASENGFITLSGGSIGGNVLAFNESVVNVKGGSIHGNFFIYDRAVMWLYGSGLSATRGPGIGGFTRWNLQGKLTDGTDLSGKRIEIADNGSGRFFFDSDLDAPEIPEPSAVAFALIAAGGLLGLMARRRGGRTASRR